MYVCTESSLDIIVHPFISLKSKPKNFKDTKIVAGIDNKLFYNDLFQHIAGFQIFISFKTFFKSKLDAVEFEFKYFVFRWVPAMRTSSRGRASDGIIYGKKELHEQK